MKNLFKSLDTTPQKEESVIKINFTQDDIYKMLEMGGENPEEQQLVFLWSFPDQYGVMLNVEISVGDDAHDTFDEDDVDEMTPDCSDCGGTGEIYIPHEIKGRDMGYDMPCKKCNDE
jgi:hypothetical protein